MTVTVKVHLVDEDTGEEVTYDLRAEDATVVTEGAAPPLPPELRRMQKRNPPRALTFELVRPIPNEEGVWATRTIANP